MIYSKHPNFVSADMLSAINHELMSNNRWTYKTLFWRYFLVDDLIPYKEDNELTWCCNQKEQFFNSIKEPWITLFNKMLDVAGPNFQWQRYVINGQTYGQEQVMHTDVTAEASGDFRTYLLYVNTNWDASWGGATEFQIDNEHIVQEYTPGTLTIFDSQMLHQGHGPSITNKLRITLAINGKQL